jgi:integrase
MAKKPTRGLIERGGKWGFDFTHNGVRYTASVGTKQEAQDALDVKRGSLQSERLSREFGLKRGRGRVPSVTEFYESSYKPWIENGEAAKLTARNDAYVLARFGETFGGRALDSFRDADFDAYKASRRKDGVVDGTIQYDLRRIRAFFALAVDRDVIPANPVKGKLIPKAARRVHRLLEPSEEAAFFDALPTPLARDLFRITFYCGLRRHEALGLKWENVNWSRGELTIIQQKTGNVKTVPLIPDALAILKARKPAQDAPEAYVFSVKQGKPISENTWFTWWDAARRACKLKGLRPHDLRHSIAQRLEDGRVGEATIANVLGHAPRGTTAGYSSHAKPEQIRTALLEAFGQ